MTIKHIITIQINIPKCLKYLRESHGFTQEQVANSIGMKLGSYQAYEQERTLPPFPVLEKLCSLYGRTFDELLGIKTGAEKEKVLDAYYRADPEKRKIVDFILNLK